MSYKNLKSTYSKKIFNIEYTKTNKAISMPINHYHDNYEIYYLLSGERYYFIKDRTYYVKKGDIILINKYDLHRTINYKSEAYERILINFKKDFLDDFIKKTDDIDLLRTFKENIHILRLDVNKQTYIETLLFNMLKEHKEKALGFDKYIKTLLFQLLININRYCSLTTSNITEHPSSLHMKVSEIVKYINNNYNKSLTLKSISNNFFISPYYFTRIFKEVTGFTFIEYLNAVRVKESQKLLRNTSLNITQISEKVGYQSITHYGRIFKTIVGISPLNYRKLTKTNQK